MDKKFRLKSDFVPTGDQPKAINRLTVGIREEMRDQVLLGVTGSGKTFSLANVIENVNLPTLVISHNKTLAAQLYQEFRDFFPENGISYFVSYYDYYQPEAYIPQTDTYIEKETDINEDIDKLRLRATSNLLQRPDTLTVASVSCIYNIGSPEEYGNFAIELTEGKEADLRKITGDLINLQYVRENYDFRRGSFRVRGRNLDIYPAYSDTAVRIEFMEDNPAKIKSVYPLDPVTGELGGRQDREFIYPAKHYMLRRDNINKIFDKIKGDLARRVEKFKKQDKFLEAQRLLQRVNYDLEMIREIGYVNGIENYSRYFDGRKKGDPPYTLLDYYRHKYGDDWLLIIDESHMTVPQLRGMYRGDRARKRTLIEYGFRLPAALDNRPLRFDEFLRRRPSTIYVSATPAVWEQNRSEQVVEQLIRPTGLADPEVEVRPIEGQIPDLVREIVLCKRRSERALVTTLTKHMAEELTRFLNDKQELAKLSRQGQDKDISTVKAGTSPAAKDLGLPQVQYLHSDVDTLDRQDILDDLRAGKFDVVVGINLLREGLDLPEVSLVAILDADKEGFLRSETSLIQTMGRAARHKRGKVIMYADNITGSMKRAIDEVGRRRDVQLAYNEEHGISPKSIRKPIRRKLIERKHENTKTRKYKNCIIYNGKVLKDVDFNQLIPKERKEFLKELETKMRAAARDLDFELAAYLRDKVEEYKSDKNI